MKISKTRLKEIIKEELAAMYEDDGHEGEESDARIDANDRAGEDARADAAAGRPTEDEGSQSQRIEVDFRHQHIYDRAYKAAREKEERFVGVSPDKINQQKQAMNRRAADAKHRQRLRYKN